MLQQIHLRRLFKEFIKTEWKPPSWSTDNVFLIQQARNSAVNCLDFWTDTRDFCKIRQCSFRTFRSVFLFEKYLMHGASKQVNSPVIIIYPHLV